MKTLSCFLLIWCITANCYALTMADFPSFKEIKETAVFIGVVKVVELPREPAKGFRGDDPPKVGVQVITSFKGKKKHETFPLLWDSGVRLDKVTSYGIFGLPDLREFRITLPKKGEEYFVFVEEFKDGCFRDIYGWERRKMSEQTADGKEDTWDWYVFDGNDLTQVARAKSKYNRSKYTYDIQPLQDYRAAAAILNYDIESPGEYWILTSRSALHLKYEGKRLNSEWPFRYKVKKGDTLWRISEKFYGTGVKWRAVAEANKEKVREESVIFPGTVLMIPPERVDR